MKIEYPKCVYQVRRGVLESKIINSDKELEDNWHESPDDARANEEPRRGRPLKKNGD